MAIKQKTGGRAAGTPNKITIELRKTLKAFIAGQIDSLPATITELTAKEKLDLLIKLMPFVLPKIEPINGTYDTGWRSLDDE